MAEQKNDSQERTEQATPKRLQQAREKGQVPRSRELSTTALLFAAAAGLFSVGPNIVQGFADLMRSSFTLAPASLTQELPLLMAFGEACLIALKSLGPFLGLVAIAALMAPLSLGGWSFSAQALAFKWEKLDPIRGLGRVFSWNGLMELVKALAKFVLTTGVAVLVLWMGMAEFLSLNRQSLGPALTHTAHMVAWSFLALSAATLVIALVDVPFQLWNHARRLRMTRQEVKDELKETDGKPEVKSRIRNLQREVAQRRMMEALPSADVVLTNPTHFAVALSYKQEKMRAPRLVAKGADLVAQRIREIAHEHNVPIVSSPMLARAVYFSTRIDDEIPVGLYVAVAQVLAYVFRLREHVGRGKPPVLSDAMPIPDELRR